MIKIGIAGLGFMGRMHLNSYQKLKNVRVTAIFDIDPTILISEIKGNVKEIDEKLNLGGIKFYDNFTAMLKNADMDVVSITLPTHMHAKYTIDALNAGLNVLCEKPMARTTDECKNMIASAKRNKKILQIGHCIRFWPEYTKAKEIIDSGQYGNVKVASFRRLSPPPMWSSDNWLINSQKSGGAALDLHIHDSDFIQYAFGMPHAVRSFGIKGPSNDFDHIITHYLYDDEKVVVAEGGWMVTTGFGFEMSFNILLDKATLSFDSTCNPSLKICTNDNTLIPELSKGDGYLNEIQHFIKKIEGKPTAIILTPGQSMDSLRLIEAEKKSAITNRTTKLPL